MKIILMRLAALLFFFCYAFIFAFGQKNDRFHERGTYRIMSYNVQNLFDTLDAPIKNDQEFTPEGSRHWNSYKYWQKIKKVYQVIVAVGESRPPELIALCEIENRSVLKDITDNTPLVKFEYEIAHFESPDLRGIDCAILYNPKYLSLISSKPINVRLNADGNGFTRDILYANFKTKKEDTLHVFVNHWPSRLGGVAASSLKRCTAAKTLKQNTDSVLRLNPNAKIIIMGDFNDEPNDNSLKECLGASIKNNNAYAQLYNLAQNNVRNAHLTLKYRNNWFLFDQIIVSKALYASLTGKGLSAMCAHGQHIFSSPFLLTPDNTYSGMKPYSTYVGFKYVGGFSDHLPVFIDLKE